MFESLLSDWTTKIGQTIKLTCKVTGSPTPAVSWFKGQSSFLSLASAFVRCMPSSSMHSYTCDLRPSDGLSLEDDPRHIILAERSGTCTLILDSLSAQDSGQYACFAHSFMGSAGTLAKVVVQGKFSSSGSFHLLFCLSVRAVYCDSSNTHHGCWSDCSSNPPPSSSQICVPTGERLSH